MCLNIYKEAELLYRDYIIQEYNTWKNCNKKAVIVANMEFTFNDIYRMICRNTKKIKTHGKILALCNINSLSFIVDLITIMITGNIPLIIPHYLHQAEVEKIIDECTALRYSNTNMEELLSICEDDKDDACEISRVSNDIAMIMFSSGTTSKGKKIPISYKNLYYRIIYTDKYFERTEERAELFLMPLSSAQGLLHQLFPCLAKKCTIVLYEGILSPRKIVGLTKKYQIAYLSMVPSVLKCIYQYCSKNEEVLSTVEKIIVGGEKTDATFLIKIWEYFIGAELYQAYGMAEVLPICIQFYKRKEDIVEDCVGKVIEEVKVKIVDQDENGVGEICVSGFNMINCYYEESEKFVWLKTGDVGYLDDNRTLYIMGRKKNMVIVNGNNIYLEVIEKIAETYFGIEEARAVGIKDELRGENILLQIKLKDDITIELKKEEIRSYIYQNSHMPNVPINIQIVDQIEKTPNFKRRR